MLKVTLNRYPWRYFYLLTIYASLGNVAESAATKRDKITFKDSKNEKRLIREQQDFLLGGIAIIFNFFS